LLPAVVTDHTSGLAVLRTWSSELLTHRGWDVVHPCKCAVVLHRLSVVLAVLLSGDEGGRVVD
jgi:hypothetical protein